MKRMMIVAVGCVVVAGAYAESKSFQASLTPDIAIHSKDTHIKGVALSIWGENPQSALAIGFVNGSSGDSVGLSWGLLNYAENYKGVQWAFANCATGKFVGWQGGCVNFAEDLTGLQTGTVNLANKLTGLQLGMVNYAKTAESGVQIGLVNIIESNGWFDGLPDELAKGMVFVNWRFE
ncbi:MAG: hypothetical protein K9M54_03770 [Kiritimatiellales bacterium]|nr:hypothetical protein [Kiritimatiellales bacterium]MCF7863410.1 hypothetical protein [Kiritimatiellales bacterium]